MISKAFAVSLFFVSFFSIASTDNKANQNLVILPPSEPVTSLATRVWQADWSDGVAFTVTIQAPLNTVWEYVGNSGNARNWSIYFSHIRADNQDGSVGSLRRCFRDSEEKTLVWDEQVIHLSETPLVRERFLYTYGLSGFWPKSWTENSAFFVKQVYEDLGNGTTRLTFASTVDPERPTIAKLVYRLGKDDGLDIITKNLENIKAQIESHDRVHPYQKFPRKWNEAFFSSVKN